MAFSRKNATSGLASCKLGSDKSYEMPRKSEAITRIVQLKMLVRHLMLLVIRDILVYI